MLRVANRTHFKWNLKEIKKENTIFRENNNKKNRQIEHVPFAVSSMSRVKNTH